MPNPYHGNVPKDDRGKMSPKPPAPKAGHRPNGMNMRTASWPGTPGKHQSRARDKSGTRKVMTHPKSEGI